MLKAQETAKRPHPLVPSTITLQYAGNIGYLSLGPTWTYGRQDRHETQLLIGYLPREVMFHDYFCVTLRQSFLPWQTSHGERFASNPLLLNLSANTLFCGEFWYREPNVGYYGFSSRLRFHLGVGSRFTYRWNYKNSKSDKLPQQLSLYYEFSTNDLSLLSAAFRRATRPADILSLGIGLQYKFF